jgi:hypothetical protein|tara:strand:- start:231 stop:935 length:705 start_codon:yes stop_codon:yes gene_type:complete
MPKAKADSVIIHRIDVQPGVKESLDAYLAASALTNAVSTVGATLTGMLAAIAAPMGGILAALVAKEGIEEIAGKVSEKFREAGESIVEPLRDCVEYYKAIFRALNAHTGWLLTASPFLENVNGGVIPNENDPRQIDMKYVYDSSADFWSSGAAQRAGQAWIQQHVADGGDAANPSEPPQGWYARYFKSYFSSSRLLQYIRKQAKNPISRYTKGKYPPLEQKILEGLEDLFIESD